MSFGFTFGAFEFLRGWAESGGTLVETRLCRLQLLQEILPASVRVDPAGHETRGRVGERKRDALERKIQQIRDMQDE